MECTSCPALIVLCHTDFSLDPLGFHGQNRFPSAESPLSWLWFKMFLQCCSLGTGALRNSISLEFSDAGRRESVKMDTSPYTTHVDIPQCIQANKWYSSCLCSAFIHMNQSQWVIKHISMNQSTGLWWTSQTLPSELLMQLLLSFMVVSYLTNQLGQPATEAAEPTKPMCSAVSPMLLINLGWHLSQSWRLWAVNSVHIISSMYRKYIVVVVCTVKCKSLLSLHFFTSTVVSKHCVNRKLPTFCSFFRLIPTVLLQKMVASEKAIV